MESQEQIIEQRKEKFISFLKSKSIWVLVFLVIALILGIYLRTLPMQDHGGKPGLWDITTDDWTLGPDLDPWLFTRYAKEMIQQGSLGKIDNMRYVPIGFDTSTELQMVSYMIVLTYKTLRVFSSISVNYAAAVMPVIFFALTIISFFLFVREIFTRKNEKTTKANIISLISTFFMIVIPVFLSRTIAGIPEKESVGFFFMFIAFYFFLKAWKSEKIKNSIILGGFAGISTALMGLTWGGYVYVFITIGIATLGAFIINKIHKKEFLIYFAWLIVSVIILLLFSNRFTIFGLVSSLVTGPAFLVLGVMGVHFLLWNTKLKENKFLRQTKIPKTIFSFIITVVLGLAIVSIFNPSFIFDKISQLNQTFLNPVTGRWGVTVAENRQPYFTEWAGSFGPFILNTPVLFWLFFIGSVALFYNVVKRLKKKDSLILTGLYVLFFFGLVFSRYAAHPAILDGEGLISRLFYYGSALLLIGAFIYYYIKYYKQEDKSFEFIEFEYLFLFVLFVLCLFTARSAVRLIMVLGPVAPIFLAYLIVISVEKFRKSKNENSRLFFGIIAIIILILSIFIFWNFYSSVKSQAYSFVPSYYNQQWQLAMNWTRENTPANSVFAHWWDYGYWVQSIGNRATVVDGGNNIVYWNYLVGRYILTGDNQKQALDFLYTHNATHLLIDSSDLGKYGAFASIGSDENFDRYSQGPVTFLSNPQLMQEKADSILRAYQGGSYIEEDIIYDDNGTQVFLPAGKAAIIGIFSEIQNIDNLTSFKQPEAVFIYDSKQYRLPLRYLYYDEQLFDFKQGIEATAYVIQKISQSNQGISVDDLGAIMYISPRLMNAMLSQIFILNDVFNNFPNLKLAYTEQNVIINSLNKQGANLREFVYFEGIQGPIKIWKIQYTGSEKLTQEYLDTDYTKYIDWKL